MTKQSIIVNNDLFNCYCIKPKQYNGNNALFYCDAIASSLNRSWNRTMQTRKMLITIFRRELYNIDLRPTEEGKKKKNGQVIFVTSAERERTGIPLTAVGCCVCSFVTCMYFYVRWHGTMEYRIHVPAPGLPDCVSVPFVQFPTCSS